MKRSEDFAAFVKLGGLPEIRRSGSGNGWQVAHHHDFLEFNLIISGQGAYFLEDRHYDLVPGTLVWLLPNQRHRLLRSPDLSMWVGTVLPDQQTQQILDEVAAHPIKRLAAEDAIALDALFSHISQDADAPPVHEAGVRYAVLSAVNIARTSAGPPPPKLHPAVAHALAILRREDEVVNLVALARACGVSSSYLGGLLVEQTGRGFVEWRNIARLDRFQDAYPLSGDLLTAALAAGFGSYTQFHRVFHEAVGVTPGEWARRHVDDGRIFLPSMLQAKDQMSPGSSRLLWCGLAGASFAAADAWLKQILPPGTALGSASDDPAPPLPTGLDTVLALRPHLAALTEELSAAMPDQASRIRKVFAENDIFEQYHEWLGVFEMGADDLGALASVMLAMQSQLANQAGMPSRDDFQRIANRVRQCAARQGQVVDPVHRLEVAAGLVLQSMLIRNAAVGARGSGKEANIARASDAAHESARRILGIDLRLTPLYGPRSGLSSEALAA